jgi:hypothetical protein
MLFPGQTGGVLLEAFHPEKFSPDGVNIIPGGRAATVER